MKFFTITMLLLPFLAQAQDPDGNTIRATSLPRAHGAATAAHGEG